MEITVDDKVYFIAKLPAMKQFHILRRLAPVFAGLAPKDAKLAQDVKGMLNVKSDVAMTAFADAIAKLSDDDSEFVILGLLSAVRMKEAGGAGFSPLVAGGKLMYADLGLAQMLKIAFQAGRHNLQDFLAALPQSLPGATLNPSAQ